MPAFSLVACLAGVLAPLVVAAESPGVIHPELAASLEPVLPLEEGWRDPPRMARVHCWWWWLNGNVTRDAITKDLEAMAAKGMGGANLIDAAHASSGQNRKPPHGPDFASPEWTELFVHTLREADRLGLEMGLNIQSGWNLGGPTVTPEQAAKKLVWSEQRVSGGRRVTARLRKPEHEAGLCVDLKVFALPLPAEGELARIENFEQKAYHQYAGGFTAVDASHLLNPGDQSKGAAVGADEIIDISSHFDSARLDWLAPEGEWLVLRFAYTVSGAHVSTSSDNWKGWAIDYLNPAAFQKYCEDVLDPILAAAGPLVGKSLKFLHTDSWELGPVNWTPKLPERFAELRGYDMTQYLPAMAGYVVEDAETSTRFLSDLRRTLAELIADGKYLAFNRYAHRRGLGIHPESGGPHAAPVDALLCLGRSDIAMGEFWARSQTHRTSDTERLFVKQPASAAHIYGRRVVMAEAFTTIGPHWERDPRDLKPVFDRVACEGLNLVMWHTFDCSPDAEGVPGQAYFAGTHLNRHTTWWRQADGFLGYLNRCQFLLQQGLPVSDVLYFYGENVPSFVRLKRDDPASVQPEFDYDVVNLEPLIERATVVDGRVALPDGVSYAALVLPPSGHYGLDALEQIARLAAEGALVIGPKPTAPIGLSPSPESAARFEQLVDRLWAGRRVVDLPAKEALAGRGIGPDFVGVALGDDERRLDYIHRRTADADVYFVSNWSQESIASEASFRVTGRRPELWDAIDGTIRPADAFRQTEGRTIVPLELPAGGSVFVVFSDAIGEEAQGDAVTNSLSLSEASEIEGPWRVAFDPAWGGPGEDKFARLIDWTESQDDRIRYYSGAADYRKTFTTPAGYQSGDRLWLDLGEVKNMARVLVNGRDLGVVWTPPFRVEVTSVVHPGANDLRVEVVNLWPNRLIGDSQLPRERSLTRTNINKFGPASQLLPSGMLGPVRLLSAE